MPEPFWSCSSCEMKTSRISTMRTLKISSSSLSHQNYNPCISSSLIPFPTEDNLECSDQVSCICGKFSFCSHGMRNLISCHHFLRIYQSDHVLRTSRISSRALLAPGSVLQDHQGCYQNPLLQIQILPWLSERVICHSSAHRDLSSQQAGTHEYLAFRGYQRDQVTCSLHVPESSVLVYRTRNQVISAISLPPHGR